MNLIAFIPIIVVLVLVVIPLLIVAVRWLNSYREKAKHAGFTTLGEFLAAPPRTDREKQDAVDLALKGLVLCLLGLLIPPLMLIGIFPLFFGARKIAYSSMGLGLIDDADF